MCRVKVDHDKMAKIKIVSSWSDSIYEWIDRKRNEHIRGAIKTKEIQRAIA